MKETRVVIVGGGFGGLYAAKSLKRAPVDLTLIDRRNFHLFQPLLYQVAMGDLSPADIAAPLRSILRRQKNTRVLKAEVVDFDPARKRVQLRDGSVDYDYLVLATGATHHYFGHPEWRRVAPGLKTVEDALGIRAKVLECFELAERESDPARREALLTFAIVGGGPTGCELAGALGELAHQTLKNDFRNIDPRRTRILLIEGADRILLTYPETLAEKATRALRSLGVDVRTATLVTDIQNGRLVVRSGDEETSLPVHTVLWAAGVAASPIGAKIAERTGARLDRIGRVLVEPDLSIEGHPEIFVIGDLASFRQDDGLLPGVAPVAMQQGRHVSEAIRARIESREARPFRYRDRGSLAVIGRARAVALLGGYAFWGYPAWLLWLFVHLMYLIEFENRLIVLIQWAWKYVTRNRRARLITKMQPEPEP